MQGSADFEQSGDTREVESASLPVPVAPPWYVITGGPGSGKTTLIRLLEQQGYVTVPEHARHYIDEELIKGRSLDDIRADQVLFQHHVLMLQVEQERRQPRGQVTFFDRGIPDTMAYQRFYRLPDSDVMRQALASCSYRRVFILDLLPLVSDYARSENQAAQEEIQRLLIKEYEALPFPITRVPVLEPNARLAFVLAHL